jgi:hypothetical protein
MICITISSSKKRLQAVTHSFHLYCTILALISLEGIPSIGIKTVLTIVSRCICVLVIAALINLLPRSLSNESNATMEQNGSTTKNYVLARTVKNRINHVKGYRCILPSIFITPAGFRSLLHHLPAFQQLAQQRY